MEVHHYIVDSSTSTKTTNTTQLATLVTFQITPRAEDLTPRQIYTSLVYYLQYRFSVFFWPMWLKIPNPTTGGKTIGFGNHEPAQPLS